MTDQNPLAAMTEQIKQQRINDEFKSIRAEIQNLKEAKMKFIEFDIFLEVGSNRLVKKASVNPEHIAFIREDGDHAFVYMSNDSILHAVKSRSELLELISGDVKQSYIK